MRRKTAMLALCLAGSSCGLTGCSTLGSKDAAKKSSDVKIWSPSTWFEEEYQTPNSLAVIWAPDVLAVQGQPTQRGFGGRVFFYNDRMQAVPVEGDLVVHGFDTDNQGQREANVSADKTYKFGADQLVNHFSPSELGASYSIWVPWDQEGGERKQISLVATFKTEDGKIVQGTPAKLFLPGPKSEKLGQVSRSPMQAVSYKSYSTPTNTQSAYASTEVAQSKARPRRTTTIKVPSSSGLLRKKGSGFTLGGTQNDGKSVSTGGSHSSATGQSAVTVGGQRKQAQPPQQELQINGLIQPPVLPAHGHKVAGSESQAGVMPVSYQK
ncbi:MAG: hypothetical protein Aurels2KO_29820 [Aureliella sp.]